jgi:glycosyltransferase involved in cell wall biosynthesis
MKILVCTHEFPPRSSGMGNVINCLVENLRQAGVKCVVCSPESTDISLGNRALIERFGALGIFYFWHSVNRYLNKNKISAYDIVWVHNPLIFNMPKGTYVTTMHSTYEGFYSYYRKIPGFYFRKMYFALMAFIEKALLKKMACSNNILFTTVGLTTKDDLISNGLKKVVCITNGVDTKKFLLQNDKQAIRSKYNIPTDAVVFLSLGRLSPEKAPLLTINIYSALRFHNEKMMLLFIGSGPQLGEIRSYVTRNKIKDVIFLGSIPHEVLPSIIACADYYFTTAGYESGQPPLAMLEAMACGLPPIVPMLLGHVVAESKSGLAFENADDILNYITQVDYCSHSLNARQYAQQHDWRLIAQIYSQTFTMCL